MTRTTPKTLSPARSRDMNALAQLPSLSALERDDDALRVSREVPCPFRSRYEREADEEPDPRVAALVRCAEAGVPTDVQALLVQGDPMRGICPDIVGLILGLGPRRRINWRDDPDAIVEDDEPQIGRDYA